MSGYGAGPMDWPAYEATVKSGAPVILPIGSFEQHGPHLPMGTDAIIATAMATAVAGRCSGISLPTVPYGAPSRPRSGGGDLFRAPDLPLPVLFGAVESLAAGTFASGAESLVVISWHLENGAALWDPLRLASERNPGCRVLLFSSPWDLISAASLAELFPSPDAEVDWDSDHAGVLETALMLHLEPELVGDPPAPVEFTPRAGYDVLPTPADAVPSTGCVNDARSATADAGRLCLEDMVAGISAAVSRELDQVVRGSAAPTTR